MVVKINISSLLLITFLCVFFFHSTGEAKSFPFRSVNVGDNLPSITLRDPVDQQQIALEQYKGKPLLLVFFGADLPAKKKRSILALKAVHALSPYLAEKGFVILLVNTQEDPEADIKEVIEAAGIKSRVYHDVGGQAYGGLGVFVMPSIILVGADGIIAGGDGYSRDLQKRLRGDVEVMFGDKTRAQVEEELHPKMVEKSDEEKGAKRHFHLAMTMLDKGQVESAIREFKKAIAIEPDFGEAHINLGCLQLDEGQLAEARVSLEKGVDLEPDLLAGQVCTARIKAADGDVDGAIEDLGFLMLRNSRNGGLHYVLGTMLEVKHDLAGAAKEFRRAYELVSKGSGE